MSDHTSRAAARTAKGFSTRAIAAASRAPRVDQAPTEDLQADVSAPPEAARRVAPASATA